MYFCVWEFSKGMSHPLECDEIFHIKQICSMLCSCTNVYTYMQQLQKRAKKKKYLFIFIAI